MIKQVMFTQIFAFAVLGLLLLAACSTTHQDDKIDLLPQLDASLINYRSQDFAVKEQYPLDTKMIAGELGSYTAVISPVVIPISTSGNYELIDIEKAKVYMKMHLEGGNHEGTTSMTLIIGNSIDIYNDPNSVQVQRKMYLPADFELTAENGKLREIFAIDEVVFGIRFVVEPTKLDSHSIHILGHIDEFDVDLSGITGVY